MAPQTRRHEHSGDFSALRAGFAILSEIYACNGHLEVARSGLKLSGIPRKRWARLSRQVEAHEEVLRTLINGTGQRSSAQGRREVVLSVIRRPERRPAQTPAFEATAFLVMGRGAIRKSLTVMSDDPAWAEKLVGFTEWEEISGIIAAAEGNNQRAMIGMVLQLAGIGRGRLEIIEAEVPEEIDEAAQSVRGADWLKAGLPRFHSAAGEALWYLMRMRAVHARMIRTRRQGQYTAMALAAMYAAGLSIAEIAAATRLSEAFVDKLTPRPGRTAWEHANFEALGRGFLGISFPDERAVHCADRVWKGSTIYARMLDRRIRVGAEARRRIAEGEDIVSVAAALRISRRDLVRVLSVRQADAVAERERFVDAIIDPDIVRETVRARIDGAAAQEAEGDFDPLG